VTNRVGTLREAKFSSIREAVIRMIQTGS
jgi:hypothetical protein